MNNRVFAPAGSRGRQGFFGGAGVGAFPKSKFASAQGKSVLVGTSSSCSSCAVIVHPGLPISLSIPLFTFLQESGIGRTGELIMTTEGGEKRIFKVSSVQPSSVRPVARIPSLSQVTALYSSIQLCTPCAIGEVLSISRHSCSRTEHIMVPTSAGPLSSTLLTGTHLP